MAAKSGSNRKQPGKMLVAILGLVLITIFFPALGLETDHWGTYFVTSFVQNGDGSGYFITITTREVTDVRVCFHQTGFEKLVTIEANRSHTIVFNGTVSASDYLKVLTDKALSIESSRKISVYGFSNNTRSSDGFLVLPVASLGHEYLAINYDLGYPQIVVVSIEDNTTVRIDLHSLVTNQCYFNSSVYKFSTDYNFIFHLQSYDVLNIMCNRDTSGSKVTSTKQIAVLSGNMCTNIPSVANCDHITEMLPPTSELGTEFVIATPTGQEHHLVLRILSLNNNTSLQIVNKQYVLMSQRYLTLLVTRGSAVCINSNDSLLVALYMTGRTATTQNMSYIGDAFMIIIPPITKYTDHYVLDTQLFENDFSNFVIFIWSDIRSNITEDDNSICGHYGYNINHTEGTDVFAWSQPTLVMVYGVGFREAYGFLAGMKLTDYSGSAECESSPCVNDEWCLEVGSSYRCVCYEFGETICNVAENTSTTTPQLSTTTIKQSSNKTVNSSNNPATTTTMAPVIIPMDHWSTTNSSSKQITSSATTTTTTGQPETPPPATMYNQNITNPSTATVNYTSTTVQPQSSTLQPSSSIMLNNEPSSTPKSMVDISQSSTFTNDQTTPDYGTITSYIASTYSQTTVNSVITTDSQTTSNNITTTNSQNMTVTTTDAQTTADSVTTTDGQTTANVVTTTDGQTTANVITTTDGQTTANVVTTTDGQTTANVVTTTDGQTTANVVTTTDGQITANSVITTDGQTTSIAVTTTDGQTTSNVVTTTDGQTTANVVTTTDGQTTANVVTIIDGQTTANSATTTDGQTTANVVTAIDNQTTSNSFTTTTDHNQTNSTNPVTAATSRQTTQITNLVTTKSNRICHGTRCQCACPCRGFHRRNQSGEVLITHDLVQLNRKDMSKFYYMKNSAKNKIESEVNLGKFSVCFVSVIVCVILLLDISHILTGNHKYRQPFHHRRRIPH